MLDGWLCVRLRGVAIVQPRFVMRARDGLGGLVGQTGLEPHHLDEFRVGEADSTSAFVHFVATNR